MGLVRTCLAVRNKKKKKGSDGYVWCLWGKDGWKKITRVFYPMANL
jgi:hypothetical protein